ncbi:GT4 family glycosyltransferase PelF [Metabacillus sp. GX 13764]|uniref:GT4 family glycosyltransferase PelF n=1 Tax=Metabacillus kandeliae TaxID=2900151 RepID=UPI001E6561D9|nr:GT4 family glycosyltransferase PelF [Metabacillus kandeliae]MCD7035759.1 GT4 family glycosyltransferase PelF [Metabacillus kandeliae]
MIGFIAEGSYPYVSGGVSSWIHTLIKSMPDLNFSLFTITPEERGIDQAKFDLPQNIKHIQNVALTARTDQAKSLKTKLTEQEISLLSEWFTFQTTNPEALRLLGDKNKMGSLADFFASEAFYTLVKHCYVLEKQSGSFLDYVWMWRALYTPVIFLLQQEYEKVKLVHAVSTGYGGLAAAYIAYSQKVPFLLTEHGIYSREREEEILQAAWIPVTYKKRWIQFFHHLSKQAYEMADEILTLFERNRQYQLQGGAPEEKTKIIPNGISLSSFQEQTERGQKEIFHIGAIVRVVPIKDIKTMIYSARLLKSQGLSFKWSILGPDEEMPEYAAECRSLVEEFHLADQIEFTGKVNIDDYLPKFDICVLSSISEGQPLAVLEGMAFGKPWIVTDVGSCRELIEGGEGDSFGACGFTVPPVSPKQLADRLQWSMENRDLLPKLGNSGRKRVLKYYLAEDMIAAYRNLYIKRGGA